MTQAAVVELAKGVKGWTHGVPVASQALDQLRNIASLPILAGHVAAMPDVHVGMGATVGSVIATEAAIIPAAVGVDIGCGMVATQTSLRADDLPDSLAQLRSDLEGAIPVGFAYHNKPVSTHGEGVSGQALHRRTRELSDRFNQLAILKHAGRLNVKRMWSQLGTLGGGNHFIELCLDEYENVWIMLHSGSRNVGKVFADIAISMAKEMTSKQGHVLPDRNLAWLDEGSNEFRLYTEALGWAQDYAAHNRDLMLHLTVKIMKRHFGDRFKLVGKATNCHHNYAQLETHFGKQVWITRKGAVSARAGEMGIIPGSMGARSFIVRGKGNALSYHSCSHGAGRVHSRTAAKKLFTTKDLIKQTKGVECRKDASVVDEIPSAYKNIDDVMAAQQDLVEIVATLKQVMCIKG